MLRLPALAYNAEMPSFTRPAGVPEAVLQKALA